MRHDEYEQWQRRAHEQRRPEQVDEEDRRPRLEAPRQVSKLSIEHVVIQRRAEGTERRDDQLGDCEPQQTGRRREPIGQASSDDAPASQAGHEGRDDNRRRLDFGAENITSSRCQTIW
jgi:hypothetical protein